MKILNLILEKIFRFEFNKNFKNQISIKITSIPFIIIHNDQKKFNKLTNKNFLKFSWESSKIIYYPLKIDNNISFNLVRRILGYFSSLIRKLFNYRSIFYTKWSSIQLFEVHLC